MSKRRVVVTGLGCVSSLGHDTQSTWNAVLEGKSGVSRITVFDPTYYSCQISASIRGLDVSQHIPLKEIKRIDPFIQYGYIASKQAMVDAGFPDRESLSKSYDLERVGVALGSGIGGLTTIETEYTHFLEKGVEKGPRSFSPFFIPKLIINELPGYVSILYGAKGPNLSIVTACTTGCHNIGLAARLIAYGEAEMMITGGSEMATSHMGVGGFSSMRALSTRNDAPEKASRPWDKDRDGFVLGDGAATLILEEYESAKKRGAHIYAELVGFGMSGDAYNMVAPEPTGEGGGRAMTNALKDAHMNPEAIDYINAHGTSTPMGDQLEVKGIKLSLGIEKAKKTPVSSTKSMTGHMLGAAGAVEALFSVLAIRDQVIPATINLDSPSEGCDLDFVPKTARQMKVDVVLSNSFGFGGTNGTLIFKKLD